MYIPDPANNIEPTNAPESDVTAYHDVLRELIQIGAYFAKMLQAQARAQQDGVARRR